MNELEIVSNEKRQKKKSAKREERRIIAKTQREIHTQREKVGKEEYNDGRSARGTQIFL